MFGFGICRSTPRRAAPRRALICLESFPRKTKKLYRSTFGFEIYRSAPRRAAPRRALICLQRFCTKSKKNSIGLCLVFGFVVQLRAAPRRAAHSYV